MCSHGEDLVNKYAWAVPNHEAIDVCKKLEPIVEVGAGQGYWGRCLEGAGVEIKSYDVSAEGGLIGGKKKKGKENFRVLEGDSSVLLEEEHENSTLLLCFPDEDSIDGTSLGLSCLEVRGVEDEARSRRSDELNNADSFSSFSLFSTTNTLPPTAPCSRSRSLRFVRLQNFPGTHLIHIGELYPSSLPVSQAPFGRTSTPEFQVALSTSFHCLKVIPLPRWPHESTTLSVWKRTQTVAITFEGDSDDEDDVDEEEEYKYIPEGEVLDDNRCCKDWSTRLKGIRMTLLADEFTVAKYPSSDSSGLKVATTLITSVKKGDPRFVQVTDEEISIICQSCLLKSGENFTEDKSWR